ncbi:MAG: 8-oxo-dGTP diphosphatase MutT [Gammaproteobacteria bacterium]|nr:MAG: 8-oxo-dGTP diphosphatase MutT [Gammaproteobacteria bacterium]
MKQISVSAGILINNDNQILLSQRTADKSFPGQWEFPGGKIESSETAHEALIRELKEELGIDIDNSYLFKRIEHYYDSFTANIEFFLVDSWSGELSGEEGQLVRWFSVRDLRDLPILAADNPVIEELQELLR